MADKSSPAEGTPAPETVAAETAPPAPEKDVSASPSEATGETTKKETLLEAVLKAVQPKDGEDKTPSDDEPPPSSDAQTSESKEKDGEPKLDLSKDPSEEELATYKKNTRERIMQLIEQRNVYRADADVTKTLREFLVTNDIAREDFQLTLDLAAAMRRGDFQTFLQGVGPYVQLATQALGLSLPPDLQNEVQARRMTPEAAAQMSRDRYARVLSDQHAARATQILTNQQVVAQQNNLSRSIEQSVSAWEEGVRQTDPDYGRKEATVRNFLWAVVRERGNPQSPEQAVEIAREAYNRANETLRQFSPSPRPTRAVPSSVNRSPAGVARSEPKSMMEAAMLGLERAHGRA
jgi:hypothetical protein